VVIRHRRSSLHGLSRLVQFADSAGGSRTVPIDFTPTAAQGYTATASFQMFQTNCGSSPCIHFAVQTFTITGVGVAPVITLTPSPLDFGNIGVGMPTGIKYVTVSNAGMGVLNITNIAVFGGAAFTYRGGSCSTTTPVAPGASCTVGVTLLPNVAGSFTGSVALTDNAAGSPQSVALTGAGIAAADFGLSATPSTLTVKGGSAATYSVAVSLVGGSFGSPVALSVTGLPAGATVIFSPTSVTPGAAGATSTLTIQTAPLVAQNSTPGADPRSTGLSRGTALCLGLLPLLIVRRIRRLGKGLLLSLGIFLALWGWVGITGCVSPIPLPKPQSSTLTITAASDAISHTATVQLTVQ